jgi:hypothetical protein
MVGRVKARAQYTLSGIQQKLLAFSATPFKKFVGIHREARGKARKETRNPPDPLAIGEQRPVSRLLVNAFKLPHSLFWPLFYHDRHTKANMISVIMPTKFSDIGFLSGQISPGLLVHDFPFMLWAIDALV